MSNVLSLSGRPVTVEADSARVPVPEVVDLLCKLLVEAQRGEIRALACALVRFDHETGTMFEVPTNEPIGHEMMAAISYLQHRYAAAKLSCSCPAPTEPSAS